MIVLHIGVGIDALMRLVLHIGVSTDTWILVDSLVDDELHPEANE